jgi:hypothetical protein
MLLLACTAVVTEIAYHKKSTIDADVSFLSVAEWKAELAVLLTDLVDEDGTLKRSTDLKSDAGIAWSKVNLALSWKQGCLPLFQVHAVYPSMSQEKIVTMTADQIIAQDPGSSIAVWHKTLCDNSLNSCCESFGNHYQDHCKRLQDFR